MMGASRDARNSRSRLARVPTTPGADPGQHDAFGVACARAKGSRRCWTVVARDDRPARSSRRFCRRREQRCVQRRRASLTRRRSTLSYAARSKSRSEKGWSWADLGLLDEAASLTGGVDRKFGHVVVDEAQDLSAMELRMVGRRSADVRSPCSAISRRPPRPGGNGRGTTRLTCCSRGASASAAAVRGGSNRRTHARLSCAGADHRRREQAPPDRGARTRSVHFGAGDRRRGERSRTSPSMAWWQPSSRSVVAARRPRDRGGDCTRCGVGRFATRAL